MRVFHLRRAVALVGLPGAGKTTVGRLLADRLAVSFADSDEEIGRTAGTTVAQVFEQRGEAAFRALETAEIDRLLGDGPLVLATGGGAMAQARTRALLLERAVTVWLDAPVELLARRLADAARRPLLAGDRRTRLATLTAQRNPLYALADIRIDASGRPGLLAARAIAALEAFYAGTAKA